MLVVYQNISLYLFIYFNLLSHHHSTSALVCEVLESVLQTVQKKNNLHIDSTYLQTVQKTMCKKTHTYTQYTQCTIKTYCT